MPKKKKSKLQRLFGTSNRSKVKNRQARQRRILILAVLVVAGLGTYLTFRSQAATLSVQPGMASDITWGAGGKDVSKEVAMMQDVGVKWTRAQCNWNSVQSRQGGGYKWYCDRGVKAAQAAGIKVLMNLDRSPGWAQTGYANTLWPPTPDHYTDYSNYVNAAVTHFKELGITHYEIWNEPNLGHYWKNAPSAAEYTKLLQIAYRAVKSADPNAKVVFGGLNKNDFYYVSAAYKAGAKGYFDIMSVHPYTPGWSPEYNPGLTTSTFSAYREVHNRMVGYGDGSKKIWMTEMGWSTCTTNSRCVSQATQADYLTRAYKFLNADASYVEVVFWFNFRNNFWAKNANTWDDQLGLMSTDYQQKPAYARYKALFNP